ncbi:type I secretion system ABC transporter, PrtD family [Acidovorax sp. CF316]|uniref:type I secretion system permease/ATPase n=1 Tax=Acidovorax sp. CF316 TaxID=1144317 RepID=UPI00026BCC23|nr:type I secretion system permease/ATPase [Acidovorax sp. CF316]EJE49003.1 type I secretion system ABC transporter, PrtD family [Acidovorax sp. CF316]
MKKTGFFHRSELTEALWTFRREFIVVGIFSMVANVLMLAPTMYMLQVFDRVMSSRSELTLIVMSLITLFFFIVMAFAEWMRSRVLVHAGLRLDGVLSTRVFNASFEARLSQTGASVVRAFTDLIQIRQFLTGNGILAFFDIPWAPIYLAVLFFLHPVLGYAALVFAAIQGALAWFGHRHTVAPSEAASKATSESGAYLQSKLRNAEALESMGMVHNLRPHWAKRHAKALELHGQAQALTHRISAWSKLIRYSQQSLALGIGALLVIDGQLSPGGMIAANVLMGRALAPIDMLVGTWRSFIGARSAFERLEDLLRTHPERDAALSRVAPKGDVLVRGLVATAPGRPLPILKGVSTAAPAGTVTVVLGPSGSGKSTLARCLMGIWPGASGEMLLDGLPLDGWDRMELGPYLGYLPQDIELFEGSIAENIARFGQVDPEKVIAAARSAGLHEMILRFPKGYDTPIGEAGNLLSGGQRQRVGLARAMYGDPVMVVLDEPNANLDDVGEAALVRAVQELKSKGCTVFLITHRPGILAVADRLLVLQDGAVVADGPRDAVLDALRAGHAAAAAAQSSPPAATSGGLQPAPV